MIDPKVEVDSSSSLNRLIIESTETRFREDLDEEEEAEDYEDED
jgi:hypothetical protein